MSFINNKQWDCVPCGADTLDNSNPFSIAWLNEFWLSMFLKTSNHFYRPNNAYLETSLVKVVHVVVLDTILVFSFLNKLKSYANNFWIFLLYPLIILCLVKSHFKLI